MIRRAKATDVSKLAADKDVFKKYKVAHVEVRKPLPSSDIVLEDLKKAWRRYGYLGEAASVLYERAQNSVIGIDYSSRDIERLSMCIHEFEGEIWFRMRAGYFFMALINSCPTQEREFMIHTRHLAETLECLGYMTSKTVIVDGPVGDVIGTDMGKGGKLIINGDIKGVSELLMLDLHIGRASKGAEIHFNGEVKPVFDTKKCSAKVFFNGEVIYEGIE